MTTKTIVRNGDGMSKNLRVKVIREATPETEQELVSESVLGPSAERTYEVPEGCVLEVREEPDGAKP